MKIGAKILGLGLIIFLTPTDTVGILSSMKATEGMTKLATENVDNMARSVANYTELRLQGDKRFVIGLSTDEGIRDYLEASKAGRATRADASRMNAKLAAIKAEPDLDPLYDAISVIDRAGNVIACSLPEVVGMNVSGMAFFSSAIAGQPTIGQVVIDGNQPPNAGITSPVRGASGAVIGVCGVYINPIKNLTELSQYDLGKSGYFMVVDRTGLVVFHPDEEIMLLKNVKDIPGWESLAQGVLAGKQGGTAFTHEGARRGAAYFPVSVNGWMVVASMLEKEFLAEANALQVLIWIVMIATIGLAVAALLLLARSISRPLGAATSYAKLLAEGDLNVRVDKRHLGRKDEIGELSRAIEDMVARLGEVAVEAHAVTDKVSAGSDSISATAQQLSQGSTEQASSAEEISASIEEMSSTIKQNAENAHATESIAIKAAQDAERGNEAVEKSVAAMGQIVEKISIIENIASQTNLLALNAAIEAARAGESGKGFAVVASEVRKLAERSAKAAAEITELSTTTMNAASEASGVIGAIVPDIRKTADLVQEIASASREQSLGIEQVQKAMMQLDTVIQQNSGASEEMAGMAEELSGESSDLKSTIAYFRLGGRLEDAAKGLGGADESAASRAAARNRLAGPKPAAKRSAGRGGGAARDEARPGAAVPAPRGASDRPSRGIAPVGPAMPAEPRDSDFEEF